jgi:hypothetical protein
VGLGGILQNMLGKAAIGERGETGFFGTFYSAVFFSARTSVGGYRVVPALALSLPGRTDPDSAVRKTLLLLSVSSAFEYDRVDFRIGPGLAFYRVSGQGGTIELGNGTSSLTFYKPDYSAIARNFYLNLGAGVQFGRRFRADLDAVVMGVLGTRRALNLVVGVSYGFH